MTNASRLLRGPLPVLVALAAVTAAALPAWAAAASGTAQGVTPATQWWLTALHVPAALRGAPTAGKGVTVAVLSTGVDARHPDLTGTVTAGPDFSKTGRSSGESYWGDEGTAVASLIAGHGHGPGGSEGITGVAPGAHILSIQVSLEYDDPLNSDAAVARRLPDAIAAGIRYAVGHGATVIALPLDPGTLGPASSGDPAAAGGSASERAAVSYALAHNVVLVAPAGDNGASTNSINYPAAYPGVMAVGATASDGRLSLFTSTRSYVALTAPGSGTTPATPATGGMPTDPAAGLMVAAPDGGYQPLASTDMSAALTAGVAALLRSRYPSLTAAEVSQALERGATAAAPAAGWGHGELNVTAALGAATAIVAVHPAAMPSSALPSPITYPAASGTRHTAASPADPGRLLRSLTVDLVVGAGVLIACLIGAITLTRVRRGTGPAGFPSILGMARKHQGAHARHARAQSQTSGALVPTRTVIWQTSPAQASGATPADTPLWPHMTAGPARRRPVTEKPPWPAAAPPESVAPPRALPALPPSRPALPSPQSASAADDASLAPWEQSPEEFAAAPVEEEGAPWPTSNTGPMYVWNPTSTTGPWPRIDKEPQ